MTREQIDRVARIRQHRQNLAHHVKLRDVQNLEVLFAKPQLRWDRAGIHWAIPEWLVVMKSTARK